MKQRNTEQRKHCTVPEISDIMTEPMRKEHTRHIGSALFLLTTVHPGNIRSRVYSDNA